jgi:cytochrome c553
MRRLLYSALALAAAASAAQPVAAPPSAYPPAVMTAPAGDADQSLARGAIAYVFFCAECHGANGQGNPAKGIPQLAGLRVADLMRQLSALSANAPNNHAQLLSHMDHRDLAGIADYLASLAPPPASATR